MDTLPTFAQQAFQGFVDDAAPATATAISTAVNTNFTRRAGALWQLRFRIAQTTLSVTTGVPLAFKLKYQVNGTGGFTDVPAQATSGTKVRYANSSNLADGDNIATGNFRLGAGTGTAIAGECNEAGNTDNIAFTTANGTQQYTELVFALEWGTTISDLDMIEFRVYTSADVALGTYTQTPTVRYNGTSAPITATSSIIAAGGGDYTSPQAWESGEQRDLLAADEIERGQCQAGTVTGQVNHGGWTTDATRYTVLEAASGHEHGGIPGAGFKITNNTSGNTVIFTNHTGRVIGIEVQNTSTGNGIATASGSTGREIWIEGCLVGPVGGTSGIGLNHTCTGFLNNNIVYEPGSTCIVVTASTVTAHVYNNTVIGGSFGVQRTNGTLRPKNNIAQGQATACFSGTMTDSATNLASDATAQIQATLTFVDAANDNYHLAAGDTAAIGAGTDLHADANLPFNTDIDGDTRPDGDWDIGADQTVAAAPRELSGTPQAQTADVTGAVDVVVSASGTAEAGAATADGSLQHRFSATGSPQAGAATGDGALAVRVQLSGSPQAGATTGDGTMQTPAAMSGTPQAGAAVGEGASEVLIQLSGSPQAGAATSDGAIGGETNNASGTPQAEAAVGDGTMSAPASASGAPSADAAVSAGSIQHRSSLAGTPQAAAAVASGTAQVRIQLTGTPSAGATLSTGSLAALASTAGAAAAAAATSSGQVGVVVSMSGAAQASAAEVFGRIDDGAGLSPDSFFGSDEWWI